MQNMVQKYQKAYNIYLSLRRSHIQFQVVHNSFHIRLLKPFKGTPPITPIVVAPPLLEDDIEILILESILDYDKTTTHTGIEYIRYLVKYQNHSIATKSITIACRGYVAYAVEM